MICPNCGASNSTRATFCRRCHQRLPVAGLAAGVTYPRRRAVASGNSRLPILAALALALAGLVVGVVLVGLARPSDGGVAVVTPTPTPLLSQPIFVQTTPTAGPTPSAPPVLTFAPLPTPFDSPSIAPTDSGLISPPPSVEPTPTPTPAQPTPTPSRTPKPTPSPTPKPTPTGTPTPTPPPLGESCVGATGNPTNSFVIGYGNKDQRVSSGWCVDRVTFRIVNGSTWGEVKLAIDGNAIARFTCRPHDICSEPVTRSYAIPRLARDGAVLSYVAVCTGDPDTTADECAIPDAFRATIQVFYEPAPTS